ncbi:MAG: hypothetical protein HOQ24_03545 [Mycobacteriaceae bacterium]|nr:hypothetical protein [Mycobacteriaceae bacterium]
MTVPAHPTRGWVLLLAAAVGVTGALAGCGRSDRTATVAAQVTELNRNTVALPAVSIELLQPGAGPLVHYTAAPRKPAAQQVTVHVHRDMQQQVGERTPQHFLTPDVTLGLRATSVAHGVELQLGEVSSSEPALTGKLGAVAGARAAVATDRNGSPTAFTLITDTETDGDVRTSLERCLTDVMAQAMPMPDAPIGKGAVWVVHRKVPGRLPLEQVTRATLTSVADGHLRVELRITENVVTSRHIERAGIAPAPDDPVHGTGFLVIDPALPLPLNGAVSIAGTRTYRDHAGTLQVRQATMTSVHWG